MGSGELPTHSAGGLVVRYGFFAIALGVLAGFPLSLLYQARGGGERISWTALFVAYAAVAVLAAGAHLHGHRITGPLSRLARSAGALPGLGVAIALGVLLRIAIGAFVDAQPGSDGATYLQLAQGLAAGKPNAVAGARAFWPPGFPLFLTPFIALLGAGKAMLVTVSLLCFVVAATGLARLGAVLRLGRVAALPPWLLAVWPGHLLLTGLPEKEQLIIALWPWAVVFALGTGRTHALRMLAAGALMGVCTLTQPGLQLFIIVIAALPMLRDGATRRSLVAAALIVAGFVVTIAPWTVRNFNVLGSFVLISTNGGDALYRANNAKATGGYVEAGEVDLSGLSEVELDRQGRRLAVQWIRAHPLEFAQLALGKQMLFLGDDSYGAYAALRRGGVMPQGGRVYHAIKFATAAPWIALWCVIGAAALTIPRPGQGRLFADGAVACVPILYLLAIHSIFESSGKYHYPVLPFAFLAAAVLLRMLAGGDNRLTAARRGTSTHVSR